jgi:hypothetical protein
VDRVFLVSYDDQRGRVFPGFGGRHGIWVHKSVGATPLTVVALTYQPNSSLQKVPESQVRDPLIK